MLNRILSVITLLACAVTALPTQALADERREKKLTLMVYMVGSTLESGSDGTVGHAASDDLDEILFSDMDRSLADVVVMTGGASVWRDGQDTGTTVISRVRGTQLVAEDTSSAMNMGAAATLGYFLEYARENHPAEEYALILWDHGNGPLEGVCFDELTGMDALSLAELSEGLALGGFGNGERLAWIGFDACLMAAAETASVCAPFARYMIASQETEPSDGWDYGFLANTDALPDGDKIGRIIIDGFMVASNEKYQLTMSCVDLDAMVGVFSAMDGLYEALSSSLNSDTFSLMSNDRQSARSFGRTTSSTTDLDLVDLYGLAEQYVDIAPSEAQALQAALDRAIVYSRTNMKGAHGLSLYSPMYNKAFYTRKWKDDYRSMRFSPAYSKFMDSYADIWLGAKLSDWSRLKPRALPLSAQNLQTVELTLDDSQLANFGSARLIILRDAGDGSSFYIINEINDVRLNGISLQADYDYSALYVMDDDGKPMTDAYPFEKLDDYYNVMVTLETQSMFDLLFIYNNDRRKANYASKAAMLQCVRPEGSDELEVVNVIIPSDSPDALLPYRQNYALDTAAWPYIQFMYPEHSPEYDENGNTLPATDWAASSNIADRNLLYVLDADNNRLSPREWLSGFSAELFEQYDYRLWGEARSDQSWTLKFVREPYSSLDLYAQYVITDTQGNEYATDLIALNKPGQLHSQAMEVPLIHSSDADVQLSRIETNDTVLDKGVTFRVNVDNKTDDIVYFGMTGLIINDTPVDFSASSTSATWPHSTSQLYITVPVELLPPLEDSNIHSICFIPYTLKLPGSFMTPGTGIDRYQLAANAVSQYGDMVALQAELDVSALNPMRQWPYGDSVLGQSDGKDAQGIRLELVRINEQADGTLEGVLHIANESGADRNVIAGDAAAMIPQMAINRRLMYNALKTFSWLSMPAGSETYVNFRVDRISAARGTLNTTGNGRIVQDIFDYWGIDSVESLDFMLYVSDDIQASTASLGGLAAGNASSMQDYNAHWKMHYLHIPLDNALALQYPRSPQAPVLPLARSADMNIDLRGALWDGQRAWIYVDVFPEDGTRLLRTVSGQVDKLDVTAEMALDTTSNMNFFTAGSFPLDGGISQQAVIRLDAGPGGRAKLPDRLTVVMELGSAGLGIFDIIPIAGPFRINEYMPANLFSVKYAPH